MDFNEPMRLHELYAARAYFRGVGDLQMVSLYEALIAELIALIGGAA
jgi:hypothetical protein